MDGGVLGPHGQLAALSVSITERDTATTLRLKTVEVTASATIWMGEIAQGAGAEVRDKEKVSIILLFFNQFGSLVSFILENFHFK